ncbi:MAG: hypothetical protein E6I45_08385 [Chloroflexi bacterium]|nr:MAG: hypothetical protein E6I45_08385 [Chloroflexota bacterium]
MRQQGRARGEECEERQDPCPGGDTPGCRASRGNRDGRRRGRRRGRGGGGGGRGRSRGPRGGRRGR